MSGMTITEKIIARACGRDAVSPGEIVFANVDTAMTHARLGNMFFRSFEKLGLKVWSENLIVLWDHQVPTSTTGTAELAYELEGFSKKYGVKHFYYGEGVCHQVMLEKGHVIPGQVIVGTDSHSCSYGAFGAFASGIGSTELVWVATKGTVWLKVPRTIKFILKTLIS